MIRETKKGISSSPTPRVLAVLQEKRNLLYRRIDAWRRVQDNLLPSVALYRASFVPPVAEVDMTVTGTTSSPLNAEDLPLFLPSSLIPISTGPPEPEVKQLAIIEARLREAQADDALAELRKHLRVRQALFQYKKVHVTGTGQRPNTRARAIISQQTAKVVRCAERYRASHKSLVALDPGGSWATRLKPLLDRDVRHPSEREENEGEGYRVVSWIWLASSPAGRPRETASDEEIDRSLRVEWSKSHARTERWREEVQLLAEEMRRVVAFLNWKQMWWISQAGQREWDAITLDRCTRSGLDAYAQEQAHCYGTLATSFARQWVEILRTSGLPSAWCEIYIPTLDNGERGLLKEEYHLNIHRFSFGGAKSLYSSEFQYQRMAERLGCLH